MVTQASKTWLSASLIGATSTPDWQKSQVFQMGLRAKISLTLQDWLSSVFEPYLDEQDWPSRAACKGAGDLFWNDYDDENNPRVEYDRNLRIRRAKAICSDCPVLLECRTWALTKIGGEDRHTILGGSPGANARHGCRSTARHWRRPRP